MKKHFYSHLVSMDTVVVKLDELGVTEDQKAHLLELIETNLHHTVMDLILSELTEEDKKIFLSHVIYNDHSRTWEHLFEKVEKVEAKILDAAESLKEELHQDINDVQGE